MRGRPLSSIERIQVKLPANFDKTRVSHVEAVTAKVEAKNGEGFALESVDPVSMVGTFVRIQAVSEITDGPSGIKQINLTKDTRESDGPKLAARYSETFPGYELTTFEPHVGRAILKKMSPEERRVREAISNALRVKPWEVQVVRRRGGGYSVGLPSKFSLLKDQAKLEEIATTVAGSDGWYVKTDAARLTAEMVPADPPTFPGTAPTPMGSLTPRFDHTDKSMFQIPLGLALMEPGDKDYREFRIDMDASQHIQLGGTTGSGKSVTINCYISQWLARGAKLAILDLPTKATDFEWCKKYVEPGWWGCDGTAEAATVTELIMEEGERRSKLLREHGVTQWKELPPEAALEPILIVLDEATGMFTTMAVPKAGKDSPQKMHDMKAEAETYNFHVELLKKGINRIAAELRFTGMFLLLATQVASATTGIDPKLRSNLPHKIMMGSRPSKSQLAMIFSDLDRIPEIPESIIADGSASRGVGVGDTEGNPPSVFKSYFASTSQYEKWLDSLGVATNNGNAAPTRAQIAEAVGDEDDMSDYETERQEMIERRQTMKDPVAESIPGLDASALDFNGEPLSGAAKAAAQSKLLASLKKKQESDAD